MAPTPAANNNSNEIVPHRRLRRARGLPANGNSNRANMIAGNLRSSPPPPRGSRCATGEDGNWMPRERGPNGVCAGKDHDVLVTCVQVDGVITAVAPAGMPAML